MWVLYRDRRYDVVGRQNGRDACFDLRPPIPLERETAGADSYGRGLEFDVAQVLPEYWMYFDCGGRGADRFRLHPQATPGDSTGRG